ncbi:hypothetical protein QTP70_026927 [Hemibagrus guttatus]|uniref:Protein translocase subunit SecA n=1 Tax=Hemibagrus guttatus TaxID=175788 RepID=A0AAE0VAX1_9TELE|nr:hypothetical protein QTP70_026927 [Hemibagrus guttatus]
MGFLGGDVTVHNETQYKWTICIESQEPWPKSDIYSTFTVGGFEKKVKKFFVPVTFIRTIYINVKYGECSEGDCYKNPHLWYMFDPKDDPYFTIRESGDHQQIYLDCNIHYEKKKSTCPNYAQSSGIMGSITWKIEDDAREEEEKQKREKEEQRRQAQLEHEKRIEEQIRRESELAAEKLSQAKQMLKKKQRLRGHELHHQIHIMQQALNTGIERDEVAEVQKKFTELLSEYWIIHEEDPEETLGDRMKTLQNELMVEYCEGKSCILAMLAVIHAIRGVKVDIVTSSPVLARRDLEEWNKLYHMFGITSSAVPPMLNDVSSEEQDKLTQEAYKQDVVYSTVGTFAADTLKQEFEKKVTRGDRRFELVLVDEVDYMTLDNGVQITFLSHESSGLQHLEQVLASIWAIISACRPIEVEEAGDIMWTTRVQNFHTAALIAMIGSDKNDTFSPLEMLMPGIELGFYSEQDFENLKVSINEEGEKEHGAIENEAWKTIMAKTGIEQQYDLLSVLELGMENKVAFNCYIYQSETRKAINFREQKTKTDQNINMLLLKNGKACELLSESVLIEATTSQLKSKIKYSKECSSEEDKESLVIPSFLEKYLDNQLALFVENALKAIQMTKGREYMIERSLSAQGIDVDEDDQHMYHAIIPVDFQASGMLEKRKRWGDGLQQFLEMKHQLTISPLSNVTNYMSNSHLFKRYLSGKGIFGVSGTLGEDADKGFLARHYKTDSYVIPAHQRRKVTELPAVQVRGGTEQWIQTICATVSKVSKRGQAVLVVCEDVNTANVLNDKIAAETQHLVTMYTMSESHNIENQKFNRGQIIITTNLGGRGTDIKVTEEVNRCGGLFVLLTYFPNNRRVEKQVFGRTGRKGTPGMVQVILNHDHLATAYRGHSIEVMRQLRGEYEVNRIKDMEKEKLAEIEMKEELFSTFCQFLTDFDKQYSTREKTDLFEVKVVAGVLVCTLSAGSLSSFGLGLISEGVSDMISGVMVDDKGKVLTEETYPGTDPVAGTIKLVLTKTPQTSSGTSIWSKLKDMVVGKDTPQSGHIDIIRPDGSRETVNSSNQNCLFHAIIQSTTNDPNDVVQQKATELRSKVSQEILSKPYKYAEAVRIQNMFNLTNSSNKFKIEAGLREGDKQKYERYIKDKAPEDIINAYHLGEVAEYEGLLDMDKPTPGVVEADHIPPKSSLNELCKLIRRNPEMANSLKTNNKAAYELVMSMKNDQNGKKQLCMNTFYSDHRHALTSGNSSESKACRRLLTNTLASGDMEKLLKQSFILAHPGCSEKIRKTLGVQHNFETQNSGLSMTDRYKYYKDGFDKIVREYSRKNLINQNQTARLQEWVKEERYWNTSASEYREINGFIKDKAGNRRNPDSMRSNFQRHEL